MSHKNILLPTALCILLATGAQAQSSYEYNSDCSSLYSRYGLGILMPRTNGYTTSMGGAGLALNISNRLNPLNPASYSAIERQTFILDVGMSMDRNTISYSGARSTQMNSRLGYVNVGFQLVEGLGLSLGYMPVTSIGYDYVSSSSVGRNPNTGQEVRSSNTYLGTGGLHQIYLGVGYTPLKDFSVGVNVGYLFGEYNHAISQSFTEGGAVSSGYSSQTTLYQATFSTYSIDLGLQYRLALSDKERLSMGAVVGIGHQMGNPADYYRYTANADTTALRVAKAFDLPMTYSLGLAYEYGSRWRVALDGEFQQWKNCKLPRLVGLREACVSSEQTYSSVKGDFQNRLSLRLGAELCPNPLSRTYTKRMCYRLGAYYNTPYAKVNGANGPKEYGVTASFTLPIINGYNNRSVVNIGIRWNHIQPSTPNSITENQFSLNLGITFNEEWFRKWKIR